MGALPHGPPFCPLANNPGAVPDYSIRFYFLQTKQILHSTSLEFQEAADSATDLDSLLLTHENYLGKVLQRCLLHEKAGLVREAILKVLNMALVYQRRWDAGIHTFR